MNEFEIIRGYFQHASGNEPDWLVEGIGDDGAVLRPEGDRDWVTVTDTLVSGRHFHPDTAPEDIGWKALAVNLSDLAAMGAQPRAFLLALTVPDADNGWLQKFSTGLFELARQHRVTLIGGDTTAGPLSVTITALGTRDQAAGMLRSGARPGDQLWLTGSLGDAALALRLGKDAPDALKHRLNRPQPRVNEGLSVAGRATAAIDVSDGLVADMGHVAEDSDVDIHIEEGCIPQSPVFQAQCSENYRRQCLLAGGDDYELCVALPDGVAPGESETGWTHIGSVAAKQGGTGAVTIHSEQGVVELDTSGFQHFS